MCTYLRTHATRVYGGAVSGDTLAAADLAAKLQAGTLASPFTTRALYRKCWAGTNTPERARRVLEILASLGWVRSAPATEPAEGRPSETWEINPKVATL